MSARLLPNDERGDDVLDGRESRAAETALDGRQERKPNCRPARPWREPQRRDRKGSSAWLGGARQIPGPRQPASPPFSAVAGRPSRRCAASGDGRPSDDARRDGARDRPASALTDAEPEAFESVVVPMSLRVTIIELKEAMCRWPLGDPASSEFRYCGSPAASGPYCAYHGSLAYQPAHDRRRERERLRRPALR